MKNIIKETNLVLKRSLFTPSGLSILSLLKKRTKSGEFVLTTPT